MIAGLVASVSLLSVPVAAARPATQHATTAVVTVDHEDPAAPLSIGPADAPVTVTLFLLLTGSNGDVATRVLRDARAFSSNHPKRVRIDVRLVPARADLLYIAAAARAAHAQGLLDSFIAGLRPGRGMNEETLLNLTKAIGGDPNKLRQAWQHHRFDAAIRADLAEHRAQFATAATAAAVIGEFKLDMNSGFQEARIWPLVAATYDHIRDWQSRGVAAAEVEGGLRERHARDANPLTIPSLRPSDAMRGRLVTLPVDFQALPAINPTRTDGTANADVTIVVLCDLTAACTDQLKVAAETQKHFSDRVRVVWAPLFTPQLIAQATIADAALCAQAMGVGFDWVIEQAARSARNALRMQDGVREVDSVAAALGVPTGKLAHCRAVMAGTATRMTTAIRATGITVTPTIIVGGRVVAAGGLSSSNLDALVREQFETGWLDVLRPSWASNSALRSPSAGAAH
jgi:protein-disulfide isomerase